MNEQYLYLCEAEGFGDFDYCDESDEEFREQRNDDTDIKNERNSCGEEEYADGYSNVL
jgi:hypothetical protein